MSFTRLSQSGLWERQRKYYDDRGVSAWNTGTVPHYITNNPFIASAYADLIAAHLDDLWRAKALDTEKNVYVVEMGGGSGRLAFYILRRLQALKDKLPLKVCYVLTDFTATNLACWREHASFTPYFNSGSLDLARFDVESDSLIELEHSGEKLDGSGNPVFFVANYLFDTLTQDGFRISRGLLEEAIPKIEEPEEGKEQELSISYSHQPAGDTPYQRPDYDEILASYASTLGDTSFLFPVGPLRCLENLIKISGQRVCLITADKAWTRWEDLVGLVDPLPVSHGPSFSMTVNFHAMAMFWEGKGGEVFHSSPRDSMLQISSFCLGLKKDELLRTRWAFADRIDGFGPLDFFNLRNCLGPAPEGKILRFVLEMLRLSFWDPEIIYEHAEELNTKLKDISTSEKRELFLALTRCWANYFNIGETRDVPFEIARVFFRMEYYEQSLYFYQESLRLFGAHKMTYHNMGLCYYYLRHLAKAKEAFERALELDPDYGVAREWLVRLAPEIEESGTFSAISI